MWVPIIILSNSLSLIYSCQLMCFVLVNDMNYFCILRQTMCKVTYRFSATICSCQTCWARKWCGIVDYLVIWKLLISYAFQLWWLVVGKPSYCLYVIIFLQLIQQRAFDLFQTLTQFDVMVVHITNSIVIFSQDIHPFYADLMNVLYDRDHYKLALGQINTARHLVDK